MPSSAQDQGPRTFRRRQIVRSAATLAWTVPAISLVTAVPVFAASGCCSLTTTGTPQWRAGGLNYIDVPLTISNGCATATAGLTVTFTVCGIKGVTYAGAEYLPAGWTQVGQGNKPLTPDDSGCYTLTYLYSGSVPGSSLVAPQLTIKSKAYDGSGNHRPSGTITVNVSSAGCSAQQVTLTVPKVG